MSKVITAAPPQAAPGPPPPTRPLRLVRRIGYAVLGLQLAGFLVWSTVQYHRFALTWDFTIYHQAWYLIAHGNLDPYNSVQRYPFWQNHSEFLLWPLALFYWVWPHDVVLLWLQDVCVVGAELVAFTWLCDLAQRYRPGRDAAWLAGAGLVLLAVNPWTWWALAWDFHTETLAILFLTLLARDLANGRQRAWAWVVPLLACGDVAATYWPALASLAHWQAGPRDCAAPHGQPRCRRHAGYHARPRQQGLWQRAPGLRLPSRRSSRCPAQSGRAGQGNRSPPARGAAGTLGQAVRYVGQRRTLRSAGRRLRLAPPGLNDCAARQWPFLRPPVRGSRIPKSAVLRTPARRHGGRARMAS